MLSVLDSSTTNVVLKALDFAAAAHDGQKRVGTGEPYVVHVLRVGLLARTLGLDMDAVAAALLHDVIEDSDVTLTTLSEAGFSDRTVQLVELLTKWWAKRRVDPAAKDAALRAYYTRIASDPDATVIKVLDRVDNLRDGLRALAVNPALRTWLRTYVARTEAEFPPLLTRPIPPPLRLWLDRALTSLKTALDA